MKSKKILNILFIFIFTLLLSACNLTTTTKNNENNEKTTTIDTSGVTGTFSYDTEMLSEKEDVSYGYNNNLFYVNNLEFEVADPSVIYITEGEDAGWFYCYGTSDEIGGHGFQAWRSKDLSHWECTGVALEPLPWAINCYWAPEVIYDSGVYYMFFGAFNLLNNNRLYISVATSTSPKGPFKQPNGIRDANGAFLYDTKPVFDFSGDNQKVKTLSDKFKQDHPSYGPSFAKNNFLDASPFIDPATGDRYLYFSAYNDYGEGSLIYGVKMIDWFTPDYSTLTMITIPGYNTVENGINSAFGPGIRLSEGSVNEGPFMYYHNGTYYLTLSVFGYTDPSYQVIQATASSPLGAFQKVSPDDGGKVISTDVVNWSHITSAGHHSFVKMGDDLFIAYHTFKNRTDISGGRALAFDKVLWTKNSAGKDIMFTNGPTWSIQPLPEFISGYKNIAPSATITSNNTADDSDVALLNDGLIKFQEFDLAEEYVANDGKTEINIAFDDYKTVRALMVYNSYDYESTFVNITKVEMEVLTQSGEPLTVVINNLPFDWDWNFEDDYLFMRPGGAAIAEFEELPIKNIKLTIIAPEGSENIAISEIYVIGKDESMPGISSFSEYSYDVQRFGSAHIVKNSRTFGTPVGTQLKTEYGYDLTHDDGTEDAYIEQLGPTDQSCYFKEFYSTSFYVEAEFTVTKDEAFAYNSYLHDPYPKFGLQLSCDGDISNTIFFYVDAVGYSNKQVGVAQRMLDNSNWDWAATEQVVAINDMSYTNGKYVKLAILRLGADFYFLCNDKVAIHYSSFNVFSDNQEAAPGFRCFSTAMKIKNYYASDSDEVVSAKRESIANKISGVNLGSSKGFAMTSGWDLSEDRGEHPVATQGLGGDQYAYFKGVSGNSYYAEINITVKADLGDPYPKFGMVIRTSDNILFYYIDGSGGYTKSRVGHVEQDTNGDWLWGSSVEQNTTSTLSYKEGEYTKLGILREGSTIKLYANDELVFTITDIRAFDENTDAAIGILSFTTGIEIKDYFYTTDSTKFPV